MSSEGLRYNKSLLHGLKYLLKQDGPPCHISILFGVLNTLPGLPQSSDKPPCEPSGEPDSASSNDPGDCYSLVLSIIVRWELGM